MCSIEWGYVIAAFFAAIAALIGVYKVNSQKSFELLTQERLKQLEIERSVTKRLRILTSTHQISKMRRQSISSVEYQLQIKKEIAQLKEVMTVIEKQESVLFHELVILEKDAVLFYMKPDKESLSKLKEQKEIFFMLMEIYDWSLWKYIQGLHRKTKKLEHQYDLSFAECYYRAKIIASKAPCFRPFFNEYTCEKLTSLSKKRLKKIESRVKKEYEQR